MQYRAILQKIRYIFQLCSNEKINKYNVLTSRFFGNYLKISMQYRTILQKIHLFFKTLYTLIL